MTRRTRLLSAGWALLLAQVVHGAVPADTDAEGWLGLVGGLLLLIATVVTIFGLHQDRGWAPALLAMTGAVVVVGFVLYHAIPVKSPVTNPYPGEPVGAAAWVSVVVALAAGAWAAYEGRRARLRPQMDRS